MITVSHRLEIMIEHHANSLGGWLKEQAYSRKPTTLEELEGRLREVIFTVPVEFLRRSVNAIPERIEKLKRMLANILNAK